MYSSELYNEWMRYAKADNTAAVSLTSHHPIQLEIVCFHCQQAGEKALKAILAYHDEEIPRTHNLYEILRLCDTHYSGILEAPAGEADQLTNFAVITRYSNDEMKVSEEDMRLAIKNTERMLSHVEA
jgi:HEPN domain-containing protein